MNDNDSVRLCSNYDEEKRRYYMPHLELPFTDEIWDNNSYVFEKFLPFLNNYLNREMTPEDKEEFADIMENLNTDLVEDLVEILEKGKQLGWHKL